MNTRRNGDVVAYPADQLLVDLAPIITFGQMSALAKDQGLDRPAMAKKFHGVVPAEVFDRMFTRKLAAVVVPYTALIDWYRLTTSRPCPCGCMTRIPLDQRFASSTCRVRSQINRLRKSAKCLPVTA